MHPSSFNDAQETAVLGGFGQPVGWNAGRRIILGGPDALWLVADGGVDVFAADPDGRSADEYLGRAVTGTLLPGAARRPGRILVARPVEKGSLRLIAISEFAAKWSPRTAAATIRGLDAGLLALRASTSPPPDGAVSAEPGRITLQAGRAIHTEAVRWISVEAGGLETIDGAARYPAGSIVVIAGSALIATADAALDLRDSDDLAALGILWPRLVEQHEQFLAGVDTAIAERAARASRRLQEARRAGERAFSRASQVLRAVAVRPAADGMHSGSGAVVQLVAHAAGIVVPEDRDFPTVEAFCAAARCRSRSVSLPERWWTDDYGPLIGRQRRDGRLVALLPRSGGYDAVVAGAKCRQRVDGMLAGDLTNHSTMLYRPLPEGPVTGRQLLGFAVRGSSRDLTTLLLSTVTVFVIGLVLPVLTGRVLGNYVLGEQRELIVQATVGIIAAAVGMAAIGMIARLAEVRLQSRTEAVLQSAVWDRLIRLPTTFFRHRSTGELASAALSIGQIRQLTSNTAIVVINTTVLGTANLVLMATYSDTLTSLAALLILGYLALFSGIAYRQLRWMTRLIDIRFRLADLVYQQLRGLTKLRVAAAESFAYEQWADEFSTAQEMTRRVERMQNRSAVLNVGLIPLCTIVIFAAMSGPVERTLGVGDFLAWFTAFGITLGAVAQAVGTVTALGAVVPLYRKLRPILLATPEASQQGIHPGILTGSVQLTDVSFQYGPDSPVALADITVTITAGEFVAVVGPTGCGKSTLLRLLLGFETPTTGTVAYDHRDLKTLDVVEVRQQCGVVLQNALPFAGTILENIRGVGNTTLEEARLAAAKAGLAADVQQMPMGMFTMISDGAQTLSGGQRQRLMIAQALTNNPRLLLLDEATSALDNETQAIVSASIRSLNATRIVIAHRLSTIMEADRVIVLDSGRIVEQGRPADLLNDPTSTFRKLVQRQTLKVHRGTAL